jgi:hypothetical protein
MIKSTEERERDEKIRRNLRALGKRGRVQQWFAGLADTLFTIFATGSLLGVGATGIGCFILIWALPWIFAATVVALTLHYLGVF